MDKFVPHRMEKLNVSLTISTLELSQKHFSNLAVLKAPVTACNSLNRMQQFLSNAFEKYSLCRCSPAAGWWSRHTEHGRDQESLPKHQVSGRELHLRQGLSAHQHR